MEIFTLIIQEIMETEDGKGTMVMGYAFGRVSRGDKVFFYHPSSKVMNHEVKQINTSPEEVVGSAQNQVVALAFDGVRKGQVHKYTVISNQTKIDVASKTTTFNNPELFGLLYGINKFGRDSAFITTLTYYLNRAKFLVEINTAEEPIVENGVASFKKDTKMVVQAMKNTDGTTAIPVYTDQYVPVPDYNVLSNKSPKKMMFTTLKLASNMSMNKHDGIVINPAGPAPFFLSNDLLKQLNLK